MELVSKDIKYYSSDFNNNSLIYSNRDGQIVFNGNTIESDHLKKKIRFYPPDDLVFTTSDISGLRVWDANKGSVVYHYPTADLSVHGYSSNCILASASLYNVMFYDLRSRYSTHTIPYSRISQIEWIDEYLYMYDGERIIVYEYRQHEEMGILNNCTGFAIAGNNIYILKKNAGKSYISMLCNRSFIDNKNGNDNMLDKNQESSLTHDFRYVTNKSTKYKKIKSIKDKRYIMGYYDENIILESFDNVSKLELEVKIQEINAMYMNENKKFIFMNGNLYNLNYSM